MKLLLDQNLSPKLAAQLEDIFPDSTHVSLVGLDKEDDPSIWDYAEQHDFTTVSKDTDFTDYSAAFGFPPYVVLIQMGNCATSIVETLLRSNEASIQEMNATRSNGVIALY